MADGVLHPVKYTPAHYIKAQRSLLSDAPAGLRKLSVAVLSSFTAIPLEPYLVVESANRGLSVLPYFGPFNQMEQEVLNPTSGLHRSNPHVVILATRLEDMIPAFVHRFGSLSAAGIASEMAAVQQRIANLITGIRRSMSATILVFNFAAPEFLCAGTADANLDQSQAGAVSRANEQLAVLCRQSPDTYVFDYARISEELGTQSSYDSKLWYLARIPFSVAAQIKIGERLARYFHSVCFPPVKCLVVDLDNTLWGGVVGEDGLEGIALGEAYPGNIYKDFQRRLLSLRDQGLLLAIASKNNPDDAYEVFERHPDCILSLGDFASVQIHWEDKATSLSRIASELNIGTDALAFFDDNPVERSWVKQSMPEITVIDVPDSPLGFASALEHSGAFDRLIITSEDSKRPSMYQNDQERTQLREHAASMPEFLKQLEMATTIGRVTPDALPRISQLLAKTNQFNLTTRRHTATDLRDMIESGSIALWLRVSDRFGDNGLVGFAIARPTSKSMLEWEIDTFLMSCRVLGRQVDTALLGVLSQMVIDRGGRSLIGEYVPTRKNALVADFFSNQGFAQIDSGGHHWRWDLSRGGIPIPDFAHVEFENDDSK
jgi:FkbH-like protein